jgi:hypothetical protein
LIAAVHGNLPSRLANTVLSETVRVVPDVPGSAVVVVAFVVEE